jgi:Na+-transporting NADH:ubiquinone oxidoreductase subunit C
MNKSSPAYVLVFMLAISVVFGIGLSAAHHFTLEILAKNAALHKNRTLSHAFMLDVTDDSPEAFERAIEGAIKIREVTYQGRTFEFYSTKGPGPSCVGFLFSGLGAWGPVRGIAVFSHDLQTMVNIKFLEHQETPGLGGRLEDPWFTDQFKGLKIGWDQPPDRRIIIGTSADPEAKNRVDAITGATQTSMALMKSLNAEVESFKKAYANRTLE